MHASMRACARTHTRTYTRDHVHVGMHIFILLQWTRILTAEETKLNLQIFAQSITPDISHHPS